MRLPDGWKKTKLGDITSWSSGGTPSKINADYWNGVIPWISASTMKGHKFAESNLRITEQGLKSGSKLAKKNDLLLLVRGSMLWNKIPVGIATKDLAFNQDVKCISAQQEKISPEFLLYWFLSNENMLRNMVTGTGIGAGKLDTQELISLEINLPPPAEQQKIAQILSTWDKAIGKLEALIAAKQKRKKALMQQLLTGKMRFAGFDDEWKYISIIKAFSLITDYVASGSFASLKENIRVYDSENYAHYVRQTDLAAKFTNKNLKYVDKESYDFLNKSNLFEGDILFTNIGDLGKVFYMPKLKKPSTVAPNLIVLRSSERFDSKYIYYLLSSDVGQRAIDKIKSGTGLPKINKTEFKSMAFFFPQIKEQQKIAAVLSAADREIETQQKHLAALKEQKKGLMQQLLTGKKRVKVEE